MLKDLDFPSKMTSESRPSYPYGYKPIQASKGSYRVIPGDTLPERERQRAINRRQNARNMKSYKILLIGESGVGKSTLVARLCDDTFSAESRQHTLGMDMFEKEVEIEGEKVKMYIWDTVGTERFDSITTQYYRGGAGIVIVYDCTSLHSFNLLTKWIGYIHTHATADVSLMLLGSKTDLDSKREVPTDDGQKFASQYEIGMFYEVSAKTGENVSESFQGFFKEIHRKATCPMPSSDEAQPSTGRKQPCNC